VPRVDAEPASAPSQTRGQGTPRPLSGNLVGPFLKVGKPLFECGDGGLRIVPACHRGSREDRIRIVDGVRRIENLRSQIESASGAPKAVLQPLSLNSNINGRTLAETVSTALMTMYGFPGQAPAADGLSQFMSGDHNFPDK
jgi:hypothetical protein